jgi:hypothetical protein
MSENVQSAMHEILKSVQASIVDLRAEMRTELTELHAEVRDGHAELKELARKQRREIAGMMVCLARARRVSVSGTCGSQVPDTQSFASCRSGK